MVRGRWIGTILAVALFSGVVGACASSDVSSGPGSTGTGGAPVVATSTTEVAEVVDPTALPVKVEFPADLGGARSATTEVVRLVAHGGSLWASTSQWKAPKPAGGAILRRDGPDEQWTVVLQSDQLRVMALGSFEVPADENNGNPVAVLVGQDRTNNRSEMLWRVGPGPDLPGRFQLPDSASDARSLGAHDEGGAFAFYAGVQPTGILRGVWDPKAQTILWSPNPELMLAQGRIEGKVTGFADCAGSAWATVRNALYRRTDGPLGPGQDRWAEIYAHPESNAQNSGLRGISCVRADGGDALLMGLEDRGEVLRFENLKAKDSEVDRPRPVVEVDVRRLISDTLRLWGHDVPDDGPGSVGYVIPAYNDWLRADDSTYLTGVEWSYRDARCPSTRTCQPERTFDAAACVLRRQVRQGAEPKWAMACLGPGAAPAATVSDPVERGQAFVAVRALAPAPWDPDEIWIAGYDANFVPSIGTGWVASTTTNSFTGTWRSQPK